ncbi:MAG: NAD(P)/FAD-dependent oxidoreductase, partial [Candidatus Peribacteraceae bacterium]|nr:NAD(P)/FAD-dependent oxidoreductase [Candidatus Peribacteraceae bacterium]
MTKIAIIAGAGPAGLTAAYELLKRTDIKPIVLEATNAIGGISQTYNYKGNKIDIGGHRFFSKSDRVMNWWFNIMPVQGAPAADTEEKKHDIDYATEVVMQYLCPECVEVESGKWKVESDGSCTRPAPDPEKEDQVMLHRPRESRIYFRRNFFPYPIGITLKIAWRLGLLNTTLIGLSYIKAQIFKRKDETYLDAFMINRFGMRLYKTFFEDYTHKVWGVPCSQIKADWGAQRIKGLSLRRAVSHAIKDLLSSDFSKAQEARETSLITRFFYPKFGPGQMWETVTRQVTQCGGQVHMNKRVESVKWKEESGKRKVTSVVIKDVQSGDTEEIACDYFFSTMPVKHLVAGMQPAAEESVQEVAKGLIYRDFMTVGLLLNKLHVEEKGKKPSTEVPDNWIYVQDRGVKVGRIQIFNNWSPYMVADRKNHMWIGLEYFVDEGDELWVKPDEKMIEQGIEEMKEIGFIDPDDILDACVLRMPKAYPAYFGSYDQLNIIEEYTLTFENLFLIGRNGMHRYNNQDHSMLTA